MITRLEPAITKLRSFLKFCFRGVAGENSANLRNIPKPRLLTDVRCSDGEKKVGSNQKNDKFQKLGFWTNRGSLRMTDRVAPTVFDKAEASDLQLHILECQHACCTAAIVAFADAHTSYDKQCSSPSWCFREFAPCQGGQFPLQELELCH